MCEVVTKAMEGGASMAQVCATLKVHHSTVADWIERYPAFAEAVKIGTVFSEAEWTGIGEKLARDGNVTAWIFNMKNRFKWDDGPKTVIDARQQTVVIQDKAALREWLGEPGQAKRISAKVAGHTRDNGKDA